MIWILLAVAIAVAAVIVARRLAQPETATEPDGSSDRGVPAPPSSFAARLFADDVSLTKGLPLSLSVETLGGVSTILIPRGTPLPTVRRETFSTAADNQRSIEVRVLVGDRTLAVNNVTVGKLSVVEIPPAPRGTPRFEVELAIDEQGTFRFSARDLATGKNQPVSSAGAPPNPLSRLDVGRMLDEARAEEAKGEYPIPATTPDDLDSVAVLTRNLRDLVASTHAALESGSAIPEVARRRCEEELKNAEQVLEANARPERATAKLNTIKADELEAAARSLGEAAKQCR